MKKLVTTLLLTVCAAIACFAQSYNQEQVALQNFLVRMYNNQPFEGVKVVSDYDNNYLLSVVLVKKSSSESAMNRLAQVKSNRQVSQFLSGMVTTESQTVIKTTENTKTGKTFEEITDIIREHSVGYTRQMEVLTTFDKDDSYKVYMFYRKVEDMKE